VDLGNILKGSISSIFVFKANMGSDQKLVGLYNPYYQLPPDFQLPPDLSGGPSYDIRWL